VNVSGCLRGGAITAALCFAGLAGATELAKGTEADPPPGNPAASDSVELYDEILQRGAAADEADAAAVAGEFDATRFVPIPAAGRVHGYYLDFETIAGYRVSQRLSTGWRRRSGGPSIGMSARRDGRHVGGYVEARNAGPIARLVVGGLRPRFGEGLVLGVRYLPFAAPRSASPRPGAVPTSSIWGRKTGAAATVQIGRHGATAAAWRDADGAAVVWGWWTTRTAAGAFGVASGSRLRGRGVDGSLFAEREAGGVTVAGELSLIRGQVFGVVHALVAAAGSWNFTVFDAPSPGGFSAGVAAPGDELRRQSGAALHRTAPWGGVTTRLTVYGSTRRIGGDVVRRKRVDASIRGRTGASTGGRNGRWSMSLRLSEQSESEPADDPIQYQMQTGLSREGQLRCAWTGGGASVFRQRYRLSARVDERRRATVVGTVGWMFVLPTVEASCQVSNYEVGSGLTGYVIRSGLPGPDAVSAVSSGGTDVSARIRVRLHGMRLGFFWDRRWGKQSRWYVSAGARI